VSARVTAVVDGKLLAGGGVRPAQARLEYSESDPWAVWARFRAGVPGDPAAVDLSGLVTSAGTVGFTTPAAGVRKFLKAAHALVQPGTEAAHVDIDAGIASILADGGTR
jgi:hypothetical protein